MQIMPAGGRGTSLWSQGWSCRERETERESYLNWDVKDEEWQIERRMKRLSRGDRDSEKLKWERVCTPGKPAGT